MKNKATGNKKPSQKWKGDYIEGSFTGGNKHKKTIKILSPADLDDQVFEFSSNKNHVKKAVHSAAKAWPSWSALSQKKRNTYLIKLAAVYKEKEEEISALISRETGKPLKESEQEARALSKKIEITLKEALPLVKDTALFKSSSQARGKIAYRSKGVFLVLGPFNFPVHPPNGHLIPALATGNTVIFKPSEKTPASAEKLAECFHEAGLPKGVFNLVQGEADIAQALVKESLIDGVLFTGSYSVGKKIQKQIEDQPHKILALEMGGKNSALVWKDADLKTALQEILKGAYLTCGQRCSATSRLILHKNIKKRFLKKFIQLSKKLKIGHWKDNPFMGPLIDKKSSKRFLTAKEEAEKEKAFIHLSGGRLNPLKGYYVKPAIVEPKTYNPRAFYQSEELFAPFLTVYEVSRTEEALELIHQGGYGLCLSVFSKEEKWVNKIFQRAKVGVFHWNLSSAGASSHLPFGGLGKSGNDRPTGLLAIHSCVTPVAWQEKKV